MHMADRRYATICAVYCVLLLFTIRSQKYHLYQSYVYQSSTILWLQCNYRVQLVPFTESHTALRNEFTKH